MVFPQPMARTVPAPTSPEPCTSAAGSLFVRCNTLVPVPVICVAWAMLVQLVPSSWESRKTSSVGVVPEPRVTVRMTSRSRKTPIPDTVVPVALPVAVVKESMSRVSTWGVM